MAAVLNKGCTGPEVRRLQRCLNFHFEKDVPLLALDGSFGPITEGKVKKFQQINGLKADGIVGPLTFAKLYSLVKAPVRFDFHRLGDPRVAAAAGPATAGVGRSARLPGTRFALNGRSDVGRADPVTPPQPQQSRVLKVDWGQVVQFSPLAKGDDKVLRTELTLALKRNGDDDPKSIIGRLQLDGSSGQTGDGKWSFKASVEQPVLSLPPGVFEGNIFLNPALDLSPVKLQFGAGVNFGLKVLGGRVGLFVQGDLKMTFAPEEQSVELDRSASGKLELKF